MSDISGMDNATAKGKPEGAAQPDATDPSSRNLEERLAIARSKREQVLRAKGKSLKKPVMKRPSFMDDDPAANWDLSTPAPNEQQQAPTAFVPAEETGDIEAEHPSPTGTQANPPTPRSSLSVSWAVVLAFAGFFGLGSGIVLSIGAVIALGWVSVPDLSPNRAMVTASAPEQKPEIHTNVFKPLAPPVANSARLSLRHVALQPVVINSRSAPAFYAALEADLGIAAMQSPAPRVDASGGSAELVSRFDFQPAAVAMTFANPLPLAKSPAPFAKSGIAEDVVPQIFAKSEIRPFTLMANLSVPVVDAVSIQAISVGDLLHRPSTTPTPTLARSSPGVAPTIARAHLAKPVVFDGVMVSLPSTENLDGATVVLAALTLDPPAKSVRANAPLYEEHAVALPDIGKPHLQTPTLARRLGLSAEAANRIRLVTFAPANVPDDALQAYAGILGATGLPLGQLNRVNFKVSKTHVRYYRNEDSQIAQALAEEVDGVARNFSNTRVRPPDGQVELWLEGNRRGVRSTIDAPAPPVNEEKRRAVLKAELESRLVDRLRRGEHLGGASR